MVAARRTAQAQPCGEAFKAFCRGEPPADGDELLRRFSGRLYAAGNFQAAAWYAERAVTQAGAAGLAAACEQAMRCHHALGAFDEALAHAERLVGLHGDDAEWQRLAGLYRMLLGDLDGAERQALAAAARCPEDPSIHDLLAHLYGLQGRPEPAARHGERALALKEAEALAPANLAALEAVLGGPPRLQADACRSDGEQVIAFSLWGDAPRYIRGAILNATLAPVVYPGWRCRMYCDRAVPRPVIDELMALGVDVRMVERNDLAYFGLFWRFLVADDPTVSRYLVRDVDCVLNVQERVAVDAWLASGKLFHVMRDYASHTELMLAGLWGGVGGAIPRMTDLVVHYYDHHPRERTIDQRFLRHYLWPLVRQSCLSHDSRHRFHEARPFPTLGRFPSGTGNVGIDWSVLYDRR